eukprot:1681812-Karenia_brevis.AAC.1
MDPGSLVRPPEHHHQDPQGTYGHHHGPQGPGVLFPEKGPPKPIPTGATKKFPSGDYIQDDVKIPYRAKEVITPPTTPPTTLGAPATGKRGPRGKGGKDSKGPPKPIPSGDEK